MDGQAQAQGKVRMERMNRAACAALFAAVLPVQAGELQVRLDHLRPGGTVHVALYRDAQSWQRQRGAWVERVLTAAGPVQTLSFELPPGRYAVSGQQDSAREEPMQPLLLTLARRGDSGGGSAASASFEHAAISVADEDPEVRVHLYTDSRY